MNLSIKEIFTPSKGVEIVINLNSLNPFSTPSIIYDENHTKNIITAAQPLDHITPSTRFEEMHLTTLITLDLEKKRFGIKCKPIMFHKNYLLSGKNYTQAITLEYIPILIETNIRSAYRMPISRDFTVKAKLIFNSSNYYSTKDFFIRDISINGIGIIIPIKINKKINQLTILKTNSQAVMGILLMTPNSKQPFATIPIKVEVIRIDSNYSKTHILAGMKFIGLTPDKESQLNKFIHMGQLNELRLLSRIGSI